MNIQVATRQIGNSHITYQGIKIPSCYEALTVEQLQQLIDWDGKEQIKLLFVDKSNGV